MAIDKVVSPTAGIVKTGNPSGISEQREKEISQLGESTQNALAPEHGEKAGYLVLGALMAAYDQGRVADAWPKLLDFIVENVRASAPAYGDALCAACERVLVTNAKAQKLVPVDYQPPPPKGR